MLPKKKRPAELGYNRFRSDLVKSSRHLANRDEIEGHREEGETEKEEEFAVTSSAVVARAGTIQSHGGFARQTTRSTPGTWTNGKGRDQRHRNRSDAVSSEETERSAAELEEAYLALQTTSFPADGHRESKPSHEGWLNKKLMHEVFLNPGIALLFAGILIGFIGRLQGEKVTHIDDALFVSLFHGMLCIFLLEMGMTASSKLKDLRTAGWQFVAFALIAPNFFAASGMLIAHGYRMFLGKPFAIGMCVLFAALCGAASYIAVPAVQRRVIPEASPTLRLTASLGVTFLYSVTVGITVYIMIATVIKQFAPVLGW